MDGAEEVSHYLKSSGVEYDLRTLDQSTSTSALAARALGCTVAEIAKSVVFLGTTTAVVVISGDRRVDVVKLSRAVGGPMRVGTAEEVSNLTGYRIGGVPPFPHRKGVVVLLDSSVLEHRMVWAAAGAPNAVFRIKSDELARLVGGEPKDVST